MILEIFDPRPAVAELALLTIPEVTSDRLPFPFPAAAIQLPPLAHDCAATVEEGAALMIRRNR